MSLMTLVNYIRLSHNMQKGVHMETIHQNVTSLLSPYVNCLGKDAPAYTHHVIRMLHYAYALGELCADDKEKVLIAGVFHDLGIWTDNTIDYLEPSEKLASNYLKENNILKYDEDVIAMIRYHHKLLPIKNNHLAEQFRKADLIDVSWGVMSSGIDKKMIKELKKSFPNCGFHKRLAELTWIQFKKEPWRPMPMLKW